MSLTAEFIPDEKAMALCSCALPWYSASLMEGGCSYFPALSPTVTLGHVVSNHPGAKTHLGFVLHQSRYSTIGRSNTIFSNVSGSNAIVRAKPTNKFAPVLQSTFAIRCYRAHLPQGLSDLLLECIVICACCVFTAPLPSAACEHF